MAFTEFYCDAVSGNNLFSGDTASTSADATDATGSYGRGTGAGGDDRYTASSGTPFSGISTGRFAAIRAAGGAAPADFIARITAVNGGGASIDLSLTAIAGTRPANAASTDCKVGGAWRGPNGTVNFPLATFGPTLLNVAGDIPRLNMKNNATYSTGSIGAPMVNGPWVLQGYSSSVGDLGKFTLDGGTNDYNVLSGGTGSMLLDFIVSNNLTSGTGIGVNFTGPSAIVGRGVIKGCGGPGFVGGGTIFELEVYDCNKSNTASKAGILIQNAGTILLNSIVHDCTAGSNSHGLYITVSCTISNCVIESNAGKGALLVTGGVSGILFNQCDFYNNTGDGINNGTTNVRSALIIRNCNFIKNGGWGYSGTSTASVGQIINCGFGTGTQVNTSGTTTVLTGMKESGSINYASDVTPWVDPANGDFRINLATAKGAGRGAFTQTASSYAGAVGYPDIGACQHADSSPPVGFNRIIQNIGTY